MDDESEGNACVIKSCCVCASLKTGSIIIGTVKMITSLLFMCLTAFIAVKVEPLFFIWTGFGSSVFLMSLLLLYGAIRGKPVFLFIWTWFEIVFMALMIAKDILYWGMEIPGYNVYSTIIYLAINFYMIKVVKAYHLELFNKLHCKYRLRDDEEAPSFDAQNAVPYEKKFEKIHEKEVSEKEIESENQQVNDRMAIYVVDYPPPYNSLKI